MKDEDKTKGMPIEEVKSLRKQIAELRDMESQDKRIEKELHRLCYYAVEQGPVTVLITDAEGNIEYVNSKFTQLTGYTPEEVIGQNPRILKSGKTSPEEYRCLWKTITSGGEWRGELCNKKKNGELYWESTSISPIKSPEGVITHFIALKEDITEHKRTRERLLSTKNRLQFLLTSCPVIVYTREASGSYPVTFVSENVAAMLGYEAGEFVDNPDFWVSRIHPEDRPHLLDNLRHLPEHGHLVFEYRFLHKDSIYRCVRDEIRLIRDAAGNPVEAIGYWVDITEQKELERKILQSERLKALGEMISGIAHEFNNILTIVLGNVQLLENSYGDHGELTESLRIIRKVAFDGTETVRRMHEFTRAERNAFQFRSVDMKELIEQVIDFAKPKWKNMAQDRKIVYDIDLKGVGRTPPVLGNPSELREVLINIINNALDAMPQGGCLSFCTWEDDSAVFTSISDTGTGMSKDVQMKLFDPFFTTKGSKGTGLGMSVVHSIIKRHGGKIDVESSEGVGTTITFSLPKTTNTASPQASPRPASEKRAKNYRILVVDDEKWIISLMDKFLSEEGHIVKAVDNGTEAIRLLRSEDFDLVLCDLVMPDVSGWDVIDALGALDKRPKVGIVTGLLDVSPTLENKKSAVDFVLHKPVSLHELTRLMHGVLDAL